MKYQCWKTTKVKSIENVLKKNSQKTTEIKIEDSCTYRTELVQNMPKIWISEKITGQFLLGNWITIF